MSRFYVLTVVRPDHMNLRGSFPQSTSYVLGKIGEYKSVEIGGYILRTMHADGSNQWIFEKDGWRNIETGERAFYSWRDC